MANLVQPCWNFFLQPSSVGIMGLSKKLNLVIYFLNFNPLAPGLNSSVSRITVCQYCAYHNINSEV